MTDLFDILAKKSKRLSTNLQKIELHTKPFLEKISVTFPEYTIHDIRHSKVIIEIINWLIPESLKKNMNIYEIYFLLAACYTHDIGMVNFTELLENNIDYESFIHKKSNMSSTEETTRDYIRKFHHIRSEQIIIKHYKELCIEDEFQARIIGRICRGHRDDLDDRTLFKNNEMYTSKNIPINITFLSAILRLADTLDLTFERTPISIYNDFYPNNPISRLHWERHLSVSGVGIDPENAHCIIITVKCKKPTIHRTFRKYETEIQQILDKIHIYCFQYRTYINNFPNIVKIDIEPINYKPYDIKFILDEKSISELLMGEKIYERQDVFIRELLQNSIDSCRYKSHFIENYKPNISVKSHEGKVTVSDNGFGMDIHQIERYLAKIGSCFYRSSDFISQNINEFSPISRFGIGILSCFMVGDKITIETKAPTSESLKIEINDISGYFYVTKGSRIENGTDVTVNLKNSQLSISMIESLQYYARHLEFPITSISPNGKRVIINKYDLTSHLEDYIPIKILSENTDDKYDFYHVKFNRENIEGQMAILCKKNNNRLSLIESDTYFSAIRSIPKFVLTSNEGIYIGNQSDLIPLLSGVIFDINIKNINLNLNLARTKIILDENSKKIASQLRQIYIEEILKMYDSLYISKRYDEIYQMSENLFSYYINIRQYRIKYQLSNIYDDKYINDIYLEYVNKLYLLQIFTKIGILYYTPHNLMQTNNIIYIISKESFLLHFEITIKMNYFKRIFYNSSWPEDGIYYIFNPTYYIKNILMSNIDSIKNIPLLRILKYKIIKNYQDYLPSTWKITKFTNYDSMHMLEEFGYYRNIYVNIKHKFIELLFIKGKEIITTKQKKKMINLFFRILRLNVRINIEKVQKEQITILSWFKEAGIIKEYKPYLLTKKDFPPSWTIPPLHRR